MTTQTYYNYKSWILNHGEMTNSQKTNNLSKLWFAYIAGHYKYWNDNILTAI